MDSLLNYDPYDLYIRKGKDINVAEQMDELERAYVIDLQASIDSFDDYEMISQETHSDLCAVKKCLQIFHTLGYIDKEELKLLEAYAEHKRKSMLEVLNG